MCFVIIIVVSGKWSAAVAEQMPLTRAAHGTSQPSPPLGWCTVDEPLSTLNGWHRWWQKVAQAALGDAPSASVRQEGMVSVRKEGKGCRRARLSVAAEAAAEVPLLRGDNVLLPLTAELRRLVARQTQAGWVWAHGVGTAIAMKQYMVPVCHSKVKAWRTDSQRNES